MAATPAVASDHGEERFLVELDAEGNAEVSVTYTYDLQTASEQAAFEELQTNETAREEVAERFQGRMQRVAATASEETGRTMTVTAAAVDVDSADGVGTVTLSVSWENLAAVEGDRLVVTEPFASGFEPDRTFTVEAPDGYAVASATPEPAENDGTTATWNAGTSLEGFEVVVESAGGDATGSAEDTGGDGDGFGVVAALGALLVVALLARRRR